MRFQSLTNAEQNSDPQLKSLLERIGAEEFVPIFALKKINLKQLSYMNDRELMEVRQTETIVLMSYDIISLFFSQMGIHNTYMRQKILSEVSSLAPTAPPPPPPSSEEETAVAVKLGGGGGGGGDAAPSAPPAEAASAAPSAPPASAESGKAPTVETFQSTECVVCMESKVSIPAIE